MKKYGLILMALMLLFLVAAPFADASVTVYKKTALTGGGGTALDGIDGAGLLASDMAFTTVSNVVYVHILDASNNSAESSPAIITPDTNPGVKRWILQNTSYANQVFTTPNIGAATGTSVSVTGDVSGATLHVNNKEVTVTQASSLDEAVAMSSKAPKESPVFTTKLNVPFINGTTTVACSSSAATTIFTSSAGGVAILRDATNSGVALVIFEPAQNPVIVGQAAGVSTFTLASPGATEIQLTTATVTSLQAKGGSSRGTFNITAIFISGGLGL